MESKEHNYYRIKTDCTVELPDGALAKKRIEELVLATNYTEAETLVYEVISSLSRTKFGSVSYEITKTKIEDVQLNEVLSQDESMGGYVCNYFSESESSGAGLYAVKVDFFIIDEKTAKEKKTTKVYYLPARSNADATNRTQKYLQTSMQDFVIRDAKFDKAEAIYWPLDVQKRKHETLRQS